MENQTFLIHYKVCSSRIKQKQVTPEMHSVTTIPQTNLSDVTDCKKNIEFSVLSNFDLFSDNKHLWAI